ncbi:hypothetical protein GCM10010306_084090 [Streptomyces umbrinus]|jgi:hypothetical protein|uniref:DUF3592 domain-containing protein n=1 Tax=Streptomyces umbrinus TaxID=67370 RepID=UPI001672ED70|nr:DUF3592 domain-containing protein [Streptomyces umbrinus]GHB77210.1 hypothetical protein GCM10010306_084090 [Streptomyces umbrinus]
MYGPAIPVVVLASVVFWFSAGIFRRGRALRRRGIRTDAKCVDRERDAKGISFLVMRFAAEDGRTLQAKVGPFRNPPALVGGVIDVVYDPKDLSNVETPGQMTSGRVALPAAIVSGLVLAFSLLMLFFGA